MKVGFENAIPVWLEGKENELHTRCAFFATFKGADKSILKISACNAYKVYINGVFLGAGPARAAHGYFRIDEIELKNLKEENTLFVEVVAYNTYNYCHLTQPAFLCAEILTDGKPTVWTGEHFVVREYIERKQKVSKFTFQRAFTEVYEFVRPPKYTYTDFSSDGEIPVAEKPVKVEGGIWQERRVSYATYCLQTPKKIETGIYTVTKKTPVQNPLLLKENLGIFKKEEWVSDSSDFLQVLEYEKKPLGDEIACGQYALYDFKNSETGFLKFKCRALEDSVVLVYFDEINVNTNENLPADIRFNRNGGGVNVVEYRLKAGDVYEHSSFEPYTVKFVKVLVRSGRIADVEIGLHAYENPDTENFKFVCADEKLNEVVEAARRTFKQNALDIPTDCPSRERAGWLCDSYFSGKSEQLFTGKNKVEYNFLENYAHAYSCVLPKGMIPMCYPADSLDGAYIPNWALFYVIELYDQYLRTNDCAMLEISKEKVLGVLEFFNNYLNEEGLLEDLESWVFVEWSKANDKAFVCGVNYPSNMLYAKALECAGGMYAITEYIYRAERIKKRIKEQSFNGEFFEDNKIRKNGVLTRTGHITETCQYYAFFTGVATKEEYPTLFKTLVEKFGAKRQMETVYPNVHKSNAFIGNYLRLMMLIQNGEKARIATECVDYFYYMAKRTGTLWEHNDPYASLNHGFASYAANLLIDYLIGYRGRLGKTLVFTKPASDIDCELCLPLENGFLEFSRKNGKEKVSYPDEYDIKMEN